MKKPKNYITYLSLHYVATGSTPVHVPSFMKHSHCESVELNELKKHVITPGLEKEPE